MTPAEALREVAAGTSALLDVRSEGEFAQGAIPGFQNFPILTDAERHQVGLSYKKAGQAAAIELGHRLVDPVRGERVSQWVEATRASATRTALVTCWRGGMRSGIASEWLQQETPEVRRVEGGYKAMRGVLLQAIETAPPFIVLAGMTGSGKTELIRDLRNPKPINMIDLEKLANHRGSSFGKLSAQPAQATFENALGLELLNLMTPPAHDRPTLVEDESSSIGRIVLPHSIRSAITNSPVIVLEADRETRARRIFAEYVTEPLTIHGDTCRLADSLIESLHAIARRLGGALVQDIEGKITLALARPDQTYERHRAWIFSLLEHYYDQAYTYGFERLKRKVAFRGNYEECRQWISLQLS